MILVLGICTKLKGEHLIFEGRFEGMCLYVTQFEFQWYLKDHPASTTSFSKPEDLTKTGLTELTDLLKLFSY